MTRQLLFFIGILLFNEFGDARFNSQKSQIEQQIDYLSKVAKELIPDVNLANNQIAAYKKETAPSLFAAQGAKRLTLRYKALDLQKQTVRRICILNIWHN
jgi:hypothetical protein